MLTIAEKLFEGRFTLWIYGNDSNRTQVHDFLMRVETKIEKRLETIIRQIDSAPLTYSHEDNFKLLENKVWELKFVSQGVRLACIWDPKPKHLVIIYGFEKKSQRWPRKHVENMRTQLTKYFGENRRIGLLDRFS